MPCLSKLCLKLGGEQGSGPEGVDDLRSHNLDLDLKAGIWALRLGSGPRGWDLGLEARIWALRLGFGPFG